MSISTPRIPAKSRRAKRSREPQSLRPQLLRQKRPHQLRGPQPLQRMRALRSEHLRLLLGLVGLFERPERREGIADGLLRYAVGKAHPALSPEAIGGYEQKLEFLGAL